MKFNSLIRTLVICVLLALVASGVAGQKRPPVPPPRAIVLAAPQKDDGSVRRQAAFVTFWQTINDQYYDKTFGGLDWRKVGQEYQPKVAAAKTDREFHALLSEMVHKLGRSHLGIIEPEYLDELKRAKLRARRFEKRKAAGLDTSVFGADDADSASADEPEGGRYGVGIELKTLGDHLIISNVEEKSGAQLAGLKAGYLLDKINGVSLSEVMAKARVAGQSESDIRSLFPVEVVEFFLNGGPGTKVYLTCLDENDKPVDFAVERMRLMGQAVLLSQNLPEQFLRYESRSLSADVGYIKFNAFAEPVVGKLCDSITAFKDKKSIILDLRGNIGGVIGTTVGLAGMLTDKKITLGDFVSRHGTEHFEAESRAKHFSGKLIVLMDGTSMSAAEMFAAGLKGSGRVVTVGERTGGKCLPAISTKLQTGAIFMYPVADFLSPRAGSLEGKGLEPDVTVALDRKALLDGKDAQLDKAVAIASDDATYAAKVALPAVPTRSTTEEDPPPPPKAMKFVGSLSAAPASAASVENQPGPVKMVENFVRLVGGREAINKIASYDIRGTMTLPDFKETSEFHSVRQNPDKFMVEYNLTAVGDVREIYIGRDVFKQTGVGYETKERSPFDSADFATLAPFLKAMDMNYLRGLKDEGEYEVAGRKRKILSAHSPEGLYIGLTFDEATGMLATFSLPSIMYTMSDYRLVDGVLVPFKIDSDRGSLIIFTSVKLNTKPDPSEFERKPKCFDVAN